MLYPPDPWALWPMVNWFCVMTSGDDRICPGPSGESGRRPAPNYFPCWMDLSVLLQKNDADDLVTTLWKNAPIFKQWKQMDLFHNFGSWQSGDCDWRWEWRHLQNYESSGSKGELDVAHWNMEKIGLWHGVINKKSINFALSLQRLLGVLRRLKTRGLSAAQPCWTP